MTGIHRRLWEFAAVAVLAAAVGGAVGALVVVSLATVEESGSDPTVIEHIEAISPLMFFELPGKYDSSQEWSTGDSWWNKRTSLRDEWNELSGRILLDGIDMMRTRVEDWRSRYAAWVDETKELLSQHPSFELLSVAHSRSLRILTHVDSILESDDSDI